MGLISDNAAQQVGGIWANVRKEEGRIASLPKLEKRVKMAGKELPGGE